MALLVGMAGYGGTCSVNPPSQEGEIRTWYDLDAVRDNLGSTYTLMNDLDSTTAGYEELAGPYGNEGMGWLPIGTEDDPFTGSLHGQGHEIRDLLMIGSGASHAGVFGFIGEGGQVEDVGVVDAVVFGDEVAGGLAGVCYGTVTNSYSTANVDGQYAVGGLVGLCYGIVTDSYATGIVTGDAGAGGLVGWNQGGTVSHCHSTCTVTGGWVAVGGLVGLSEGIVTNSYSTGNVIGNGPAVGGLVGSNGWSDGYSPGTVSDSYSTGSVTGEDDAGGLVGLNWHESIVSNSYATGNVDGRREIGGLVGASAGSVSDSYSTGNVTGEADVGGLVGSNYGIISNSFYNHDEVLINGENIIMIGALFGEDFDQWLADGKFLDVNEMFSQESGYYVISDVDDFEHLLAFCQDNSLKFRLINDLDFATEPNLYIPYLAGEFDGNGYKISNLSFNFDFISRVGLFGYLAPGAEVTQLGVENMNITGDRYVGGLAGENYGTVSDAYATGSVTGRIDVGGLVGENEGTVSNSHSMGSVTGNYAGGLVGENEGTVSNSYSASNTTTNDRLVGGLVGRNSRDGIVSDCHATGSVTGKESEGAGGLVGENWGTVSASYATGSVTGNVCVGGLLGENHDCTVSASYSTGIVTGNAIVGGLVGWNYEGTVTNSYSDSNVTGIVGIGGLVGVPYKSTVSNSYSTGSVTGEAAVGGLVGENCDSTVSNSYALGSVSGNESVGGLVGANNGTISDSYATGSVSGLTDVGGLVGANAGNVTSSFWDTETSGQATSDGGTGKTTAEMQEFTTFSGATWDITIVANASIRNPSYIWNIVDTETYPFLSWQP